MRKFSIALLAGTALLTTQAFAADLIIETPMEPGVVTVSGDWEGAYIGVFGGYASGELTDGVAGTDIDGWLVGFAAGYDLYLADSIVAGVVADIAWNDINDGANFSTDWNGSLRARLGYDAGAFLPYVTGGFAFTNGDDGVGVTNTHWGWTVGAGVEVAVAEQLSLDLQYRYTDYAPETYSGPTSAGALTHTATIGLNWRF